MAKDSGIEWTHHTFNPWWGCVKLSPACAHCYAETWARRVGMDLWGGDAPRRFFSEHHWREPLKWNAEAEQLGTRARVFCASMADVFEPRTDLDPWREKLWGLIEQTPHLDWLLLTKRPGHIKHVYPWLKTPRDNVWLGTTAENQRWANRRIERLTTVDAHVRFLSCEPLLSAIDLKPWLKAKQITWIIAGGESGAHARPTHTQTGSAPYATNAKPTTSHSTSNNGDTGAPKPKANPQPKSSNSTTKPAASNASPGDRKKTSAKRRLGVATRLQAIVEALASRQISFGDVVRGEAMERHGTPQAPQNELTRYSKVIHLVQ